MLRDIHARRRALLGGRRRCWGHATFAVKNRREGANLPRYSRTMYGCVALCSSGNRRKSGRAQSVMGCVGALFAPRRLRLLQAWGKQKARAL